MMASSSSNSYITSLKLLFISTGLISLAITTKLTVPLMLNFAVNDLPTICSIIISWMKPPYLYLIINAIIITIVASTRFQPNNRPEHQSQQALFEYDNSNASPPLGSTPDAVHLSYDIIKPSVTVEHKSKCYDMDVERTVVEDQEDELIKTTYTSFPMVNVLTEVDFPVKDKHVVSHTREPTKNIQKGERALRVLKPKKQETLDSTWKMITEGRNKPVTRQFRKSDTFVNMHHDRLSNESTTTAKTKVVRKSETFKDRKAYENQNHHPQSRAAGEKLKICLSPSHEELNRRVEAFIKKFNEDMRLQRQASLDQYMEMVKGGDR